MRSVQLNNMSNSNLYPQVHGSGSKIHCPVSNLGNDYLVFRHGCTKYHHFGL